MLRDAEVSGLIAAAHAGNSAFALDLMRSIARQGRIRDVAEVIDRYHRNVEINKAPARRFLAERTPGILSNQYFPSLGDETFRRFIDYSTHHRSWAEPLVQAANDCDGEKLERLVDGISSALSKRAGTSSENMRK